MQKRLDFHACWVYSIHCQQELTQHQMAAPVSEDRSGAYQQTMKGNEKDEKVSCIDAGHADGTESGGLRRRQRC